MPETEDGRFGCPKQVFPSVRWIAVPQAFRKDHIGIAFGPSLSQRVFVVHPGIHDGFVLAAKTKKQSKSTQELRAAPVPMSRAERIAKLKLRRIRVLRYLDENQI